VQGVIADATLDIDAEGGKVRHGLVRLRDSLLRNAAEASGDPASRKCYRTDWLKTERSLMHLDQSVSPARCAFPRRITRAHIATSLLPH